MFCMHTLHRQAVCLTRWVALVIRATVQGKYRNQFYASGVVLKRLKRGALAVQAQRQAERFLEPVEPLALQFHQLD